MAFRPMLATQTIRAPVKSFQPKARRVRRAKIHSRINDQMMEISKHEGPTCTRYNMYIRSSRNMAV